MLPGGVDGSGYGLHPALLDACLHAGALAAVDGTAPAGLPFSWAGVSLQAKGATAVRAVLTPAGPGAATITITDTAGTPVATVQSLATRPIPAGGPGGTAGRGAADRDTLFRVEWVPAPAPTEEPGPVAVLGTTAGAGGGPQVRVPRTWRRCPVAPAVVVPVAGGVVGGVGRRGDGRGTRAGAAVAGR